MIWWLWTACDPVVAVQFDVNAAWRWVGAPGGTDIDDVTWLGEGAWVFRADTMGLGLR